MIFFSDASSLSLRTINCIPQSTDRFISNAHYASSAEERSVTFIFRR